MIALRFTQQSLDTALGSLLQWGIGGCVLAVFVAPTFFWLVRSTQKREDERGKRDERDANERIERERKLVDALVDSVNQQKHALDQWRAFEVAEEKVHTAILAGLGAISDRLAQQTSLQTDSAIKVASILDKIAARLEHKP